MSRQWKVFESEVAKRLGGTRNVRVSYGEWNCDVTHPYLAIECKYGGQVPKFLCGSRSIAFGEYVAVSPDVFDTGALYSTLFKEEKKNKFVEDGIKQASSYWPDKVPVLCVKRNGMKGFRIILKLKDWLTLGDRIMNVKYCDGCGQEIRKEFYVMKVERMSDETMKPAFQENEFCPLCKEKLRGMVEELKQSNGLGSAANITVV